MRDVIIFRHKVTDNYSLGVCYIIMEDNTLHFVGVTMERGWQDNKSNISCVPEGVYDLRLEMSGHFKTELWELYGVPGRSECKFHVANYWKQLNGCIAFGRNFEDIDHDGDLDTKSSGTVLKEFHALMRGKTAKLTIRNI